DLRDPAKIDHPMTLAKLRQITLHLNWPAYFRDVGLSAPVRKVNVAEPRFYRRLDELIGTLSLDDWKVYLRYHAVAHAAPWLSTPFVDEDFRFRSKFSGAKELLPRWKRCLRETDAMIGEALGQAYVGKTFPP